MSRKWGTRLAVLATSVGLAGFGLLSAGAGTAMAEATPGTTGPGSFQFLTFSGPNWVMADGIQTTGGGQPTTEYQAVVQPPINAPGQIPGSVFSNKTRTIPVKYKVQSRACTPGSSTVYPDTLKSYAVGDPNDVRSTNLYWNAPAGLTVGQISNLTADFTWAQGSDHGGSLRWQIDTPDGNIWVYYGDPYSFTSETEPGYSGQNMMAFTDARFEGNGGFHGSPEYDTLANVLARPVGTGTVADEPVESIGLIVDGGWGGGQAVQLDADAPAVTIGTAAGTATYTPGTVNTDPSCTGWMTDNSQPAYLYLYKSSGQTPAAQIDEGTFTSTQGDYSGQFRQVDGMYIYNLPLSQLTDLSATYTVGISPNSNGSDPISTVQFGLK